MRHEKSQTQTDEMDVQHQLPSHREGPDDAARSSGRGAGPEEERQILLDRLARVQAEFENARRRMAREQQEFKDFAVADAVKSLLPVLDSFELALHGQSNNLEELRFGMDLIQRQLRDALTKLGVQPVPAMGERFDPTLHEAVEVRDSPEAGDGQIVHELRRGYRLGDRLLRPSMVVVAGKTEK